MLFRIRLTRSAQDGAPPEAPETSRKGHYGLSRVSQGRSVVIKIRCGDSERCRASSVSDTPTLFSSAQDRSAARAAGPTEPAEPGRSPGRQVVAGARSADHSFRLFRRSGARSQAQARALALTRASRIHPRRGAMSVCQPRSPSDPIPDATISTYISCPHNLICFSPHPL